MTPRPRSVRAPTPRAVAWGRRRLLLGGASLALTALVGQAPDAGAAPAACGTPPSEPAPFAPPPDESVAGGSPRTVGVDGGGYRFRYLVDGRPTRVYGMGYNPLGLEASASERLVRLRRDFALMGGAGVNTVFGWDPAAFDRLTLDAAEEAGLGVAPPFDVDFRTDYRAAWARALR